MLTLDDIQRLIHFATEAVWRRHVVKLNDTFDDPSQHDGVSLETCNHPDCVAMREMLARWRGI